MLEYIREKIFPCEKILKNAEDRREKSFQDFCREIDSFHEKHKVKNEFPQLRENQIVNPR